MPIIDTLKDSLEFLFIDKRMKVIITFFLVFYGATASPNLPDFILDLFKNEMFRVLILSLIVYKGNSNPTFSILIAFSFVLIMNMINKREIVEGFRENFKETFTNNNNYESQYHKSLEKMTDLSSAEIVQKWSESKYDRIKEDHGGIQAVCTKNLPQTKWADSCIPIYMENGVPKVDPDCKESELSKAMRGNTPIKDATNVVYNKINDGEYSSKEVLQYTVISDQSSPDFGTCSYQYKTRKFPIKECTKEGRAKCGNTEFPKNLSEMDYCTNPQYEQGNVGSCIFSKKIVE